MQNSIQILFSKVAQFWLPLFVCMLLVISIVSLRPLDLALPHHSDKLGHLIAYGSLIFPVALRKPRYFIWIFIALSLWSGVIEVLQNYVGRHGDWLDWLANTVGLALGTGVGLFSGRFKLR